MNRTDRLYALVEELRAVSPRGRTARQLADHFEVSVRTIERDLSALGQAGVPLTARQGRDGGYTLDRSMSLPPLNVTPSEAAAVAVALSHAPVLFRDDARSALRKIAAAMPELALAQARATAGKVRLLAHPVPDLDARIAGTIWSAVREGRPLRIRYTTADAVETEREIEPHHVMVGPSGTYLIAWCRLRADDRVFRMDRITAAERAPSSPRPERAVAESARDGHRAKLPPSALRPEDLLPNSDIGLSHPTETMG